MLETGLFQGARAKKLAQLVQPDLFANVKLDQYQHGTTDRRFDGDFRHTNGVG